MSEKIVVDTAAIGTAAGHLEALKAQLEAALTESSRIVNNLEGSWSGPAASAAIGNFQSFNAHWFANYGRRMESFSQYLRDVAQHNWGAIEEWNRKNADVLP